MRIYITHCSANKDTSLKGTGKNVTPQELYTSVKTQCFMRACIEKGVQWAIFSDEYGVWFPDERHEYYEKCPVTVTEEEFGKLLRDFDERLRTYDEIWFYHNPGRFHSLYKRLIAESKLRDSIKLFSRSSYIGL